MKLRILSATDVRAALSMGRAIESARTAFSELARGQAELPPRASLSTASGVTLFMPGFLGESGTLAHKMVSVYGANAGRGLPVISGLLTLIDAETGVPLAVMDGASLTAIRTGAASGLATDLLARPGCRTAAMLGAGAQAWDQVMALLEVRPLQQIRVWSRGGGRARELAERLAGRGVEARAVADASTAVRGADIVSCATPSTEPLFQDRDIAPGTHINAVGSFTPDMREVPARTVVRARVVVDQLEAALKEAGDLLQPLRQGIITRDHLADSLGELATGQARGRGSEEQVTLFKSVGLAVQDAAAARAALEEAERRQIGQLIDL